MRLLYTFGIYIFGAGIYLAALFMPKAKKWVGGRRGWDKKLERKLAGWPADAPRIWIHCASLGEFEQGRPLLEKIKSDRPEFRILLSFFSPSGYEIRKDYPQADAVTYLPLDTPARARRFLEIVRPDAVVFVKYEFWFNFLTALRRRGIPHFLIAGLFREQQHFFRWYGGWSRRHLRGFSGFFLQDSASAALLEKLGIEQVKVVGDPRVDRVCQLAESAGTFSKIERFLAARPALVVGSSWPADEAFLLPFINRDLPQDWAVILAPHEIGRKHLEQIEAGLRVSAVRYSRLSGTAAGGRVLIIDNIGMLSALYQYGKVAYIGGGFGKGIHNTLEPIAFGLPLIFGPRYEKFTEARIMVECGAAMSISDTGDLAGAFDHFKNPTVYSQARKNALTYLKSNRGATEKIMRGLLDQISAT